jgi:hypothetical protein
LIFASTQPTDKDIEADNLVDGRGDETAGEHQQLLPFFCHLLLIFCATLTLYLYEQQGRG